MGRARHGQLEGPDMIMRISFRGEHPSRFTMLATSRISRTPNCNSDPCKR